MWRLPAALSAAPAASTTVLTVELRALLSGMAWLASALRLTLAGLSLRSLGLWLVTLARRLLLVVLLLLLVGLPLVVALVVSAATPTLGVAASLALPVSTGFATALASAASAWRSLGVGMGALGRLGW